MPANPADDAEYQKYLADKKAAEEPAEASRYYVHLADGSVVVLDQDEADETGTHHDGIAVIGKYKVGA
jgi:hypothetical protein